MGEVLAVSFASPLYAAVIECAPTDNVGTTRVAFESLIAADPRAAVPSLNWTVPLAEEGVTDAVKVTDCPIVEGFAEEVTTTLEPTWLTVWTNAGDVLAALLASPLYAAVIECVPTLNDVAGSAACPPLSGTGAPRFAVPS
jgi:hypothetical protein